MTPVRRSFPAPVAFPPAPQPLDNAGVPACPNVFELDAPLSADERAWLDADVSPRR